MSKTIEFSITDMVNQFEADLRRDKDEGPAKPQLSIMCDELTCHVYVNATLMVLEELGEKEDTILHVNDRMTFADFPGSTPEVLDELSEMAGIRVTLDTFLWEAAKALSTGECDVKSNSKRSLNPRYN